MAGNLQTISEIRHNVSGMLRRTWPEKEADAMASAIIREYTGTDNARQLAFGERTADTGAAESIMAAARRASAGEPLQYIFGYTIFCGHRIGVEPGVLIPRPETEEMVSLIISENPGFSGTVADICTGSGCIAIALSIAFPEATVLASDNSDRALQVAARNISAVGAAVQLSKADILAQEPAPLPVSNIIVSNPPYVTESEKKAMHANVLDHEPHEALFVPDRDPLLYYRHIIAVADASLAPRGSLWLEVNESFAENTARLLRQDIYRNVRVIEDIRGKKRFVKAEKNG
ncbi:MAG TPA: peptide chain release factor N(5)-glutamine methyltransferase [Bacteroidales bacterium]|nr:peptide chain release factor N(5)-glutamine methyltransferase [Bacteroidales bacterium]